MYKILEKKALGPGMWYMRIQAPLVARRAMPGQFIMFRITEEGERVPLTIADFDRQEGWVTIIFQEVGFSTKQLGRLEQGDHILDFAGPLGQPSVLDGFKKVLCIGGGVGIAPLYPQIKQLSQAGASVSVIIGARSKDYIILEEEIKGLSDSLYIATDDGSYGQKGFVTDILKDLITKQASKYDLVIAIGPLVMMKAVADFTRAFAIPTRVSLNPIMVDGTGMCGGCRVTVGGQTKYACVDGPEFDGHLVDFDEAMRRQGMYKQEERVDHFCRLTDQGGGSK
ncbi:MAG: sulfide/dihydroorotate dehydrogenase-like FAD/NAD-binding protein [Clostridiales bacterium]|jgi:ferredoxin--NADP+ reductase|nr:sulfide/dihydroorotate dehydrogenase-like FAD/NAD-binding protein [Clostridiales bacterium]